MATYVMSDLHGAFDALQALLEEIRFSPEDTLYIMGDVVDRGQEGVEILRFAMRTPNIQMLLGNHEYMAMQYFSGTAETAVIRRWNRNNNFFTLAGFDKLTAEEKQETLDYIAGLPDHVRLTVNGIKYYLVHGFTGESTHDKVWNRPKYDTVPDLPEDEHLVIGHTPVCEFVCPGTDENMYVYSHGLTEKGDHFRILHAPHFTNIDCCVGYGFSAARLACLRLDDGAEFYHKVRL